MKRKLQLPLVALLVCVCTMLSGQRMLHKANKQFDLKHYNEAIITYKQFLDKEPSHLQAKSNLAEAYRMTNQLTLAEQAYAAIMSEEHLDPIYIRNYGVTLMKMAKYNEAHYQFELYKIYNPQDAQHYQLSCEYAHHLYRDQNKYEVEHVGVNTVNSDFGIAFVNDDLIFSSFRNDIELSEDAVKKGQKLTGNMLYTANLTDDLRAEDVKFLRSGIAEKKNIGPISFAPEAELCAFTRNKIQNGGAHVTGDDSYHSIYIADLKPNGDWNNERPFRYNEFGTSTGFPSLAFDGSALYFSSNRVGGMGGYDIYVSYWKDNTWTYPENLGSEINTPGNEITPYFTDEELYFASDYHHGMGGYDIFHTEVNGGKWSHPENMANGINSPADDYYPSIKRGTEGIFFSSNRLGGRGMDDIYLAVPISNDVMADAGFMPEAVTLTSIDSDIASAPSNPIAKTVSNDEEIQVTVLNDVTEPEVLQKKEKEEELPMWGFAEPTEKIVIQKPRAKVEIDYVANSAMASVENTSAQVPMIEGMKITTDQNQILDQNIVEMEAETSAVSVTSEVATEQVVSEIITQTEPTVVAAVQVVPTQDEPTHIVEPTVVTPQEEIVAVEEKPESFKIPNYKAISASRAPLNLDLAGAKRVALGEILPASNVYFIQLAALSRTSGNVDQFKSLAKYGNLYKVFKSSSTKIKLGYFLDKSEAQQVLKNVKSRGHKDAFITKDDLGSIQIELIVANDEQQADYTSYDSNTSAYSAPPAVSKPSITQPRTGSGYDDDYSLNKPGRDSYKIRLASYEDPIWFDIDKAKQLGKIEQWTKGDWTIFILGGYSTYSDAEQAMIRAVNKGFADAEIVIDNNGILERLKQN